MSARKPTIVAVCAISVMAIALIVATQILIRRFDNIELDQSADKALQAIRALQADLNQLAVSTRDYAEWDDAQQYILDRDTQFLAANFSFASLDGMQVDHMAIIDRTGTVLYRAQIDPQREAIVERLPASLEALLKSLHAQRSSLRSVPSIQRIVRTDEGLLAFSVIEITRSDHSGQTGASLFFARLLEDDEIERTRQTSQLPVRFEPLAAGVTNVADVPSFAITVDSNLTTGVAIVRDWRGMPLAKLSVSSQRAIGTLGRRTTTALMGTIGLLALACAGLFTFMSRRERRHWQQQIALRARQERILASLDECIALVDPRDGKLVEGNAALERTLDYSRDDMTHLGVRDVFVDCEESLLRPDAEAGRLRDCRLRARDGRFIECEVSSTHLADQDPPLVCVVARDVTQRRLTEQQLHENRSQLAHLSEHDALTGLPNRQCLQTRLAKLLHRMGAEERALGLLYFDLDHFKNINDSRGHGFGDQLLKSVAQRLRSEAAAEDLVLRMGGDEFLVVTTFEGGAAALKNIAKRLLAAVSAPIVLESESISISASVGIAAYPEDGLEPETLLKNADIALYQAKAKGRNCFACFAHDMNVQLSEHVALEQALRHALNTDQIQIAYQPVVDLHTGLLVSFEALARWQHPEMGPVPPGRFIPVADRSGLIVPLGEQILREVIKQLREWQTAGLTLAPVAINVAPIQFERTEFATLVHETAMEFDIDPRLVAFEVTESTLLQDSSKHIVTIDTLRHAGSRVYIDDFGTGFSNLGYLKTLPVDAVKIDQSFVRAIETDPNDAAIVSSIVSVARQLRLDTIAEGIETAKQAELLRELGCMYGQGYYFSKPMPAGHCRALLEQLGAARRLTETVKTRAFRQAAG